MLAFDLGSEEAARRFLNQVKICSLAESLGGVESLISLPAQMTHASMPKEVRDRVGITDSLVRLSRGDRRRGRYHRGHRSGASVYLVRGVGRIRVGETPTRIHVASYFSARLSPSQLR